MKNWPKAIANGDKGVTGQEEQLQKISSSCLHNIVYTHLVLFVSTKQQMKQTPITWCSAWMSCYLFGRTLLCACWWFVPFHEQQQCFRQNTAVPPVGSPQVLCSLFFALCEQNTMYSRILCLCDTSLWLSSIMWNYCTACMSLHGISVCCL